MMFLRTVLFVAIKEGHQIHTPIHSSHTIDYTVSNISTVSYTRREIGDNWYIVDKYWAL